MSQHTKLSFQNATGRLRVLRLEPWARHFVLEPDEKVGVVVQSGADSPGFRVVEAGESTLFYTSGSLRAWVVQGGITHELLPVHETAAPPTRGTHREDNPMWDPDVDLVR